MKPDFHFHEWAFLAKADIESFERRRSQLLEEFLRESGSRRAQLERLQCKIDEQRKAAASPEEAVVVLSGLMCESFCKLIGEIHEFRTDLQKLERLQALVLRAGTGAGVAVAATAERPSGEALTHDHQH